MGRRRKEINRQKFKKKCVLGMLLFCGCFLWGCSGEDVTEFAVNARERLQVFLTGEEEASSNAKEADDLSIETVLIASDKSKETGKETTNSKVGENSFRNGFVLLNPGRYGYDSLNERQKGWYREMVAVLGGMESDVRLAVDAGQSGLDEMDIDRIFHCVMMDHPEFFYVDGYNYNSLFTDETLSEIRFSGTYTLTKEEAENRLFEIEEEAEKILENIDADASDYEKIKYVYDTIILATDYDLNAPDNQNIYSVLVGHASVCQGYSEAMQYLLLRLGIENSVIHGFVEGGESHAWNLVKADGKYYYVDVTWGDASYRNSSKAEQETGKSFVNYDYLCITTEELLRTHSITDEVEMPLCTAVEDNYFVKEGLLFEKYDPDRLNEIISNALQDEKSVVTVKCKGQSCYREMYRELINNNKIFDCLPDHILEINYANNDNQYTLTFWLD